MDMDRARTSQPSKSQYSGVLSPLTAALVMAHDGSYTLQTSAAVLDQLASRTGRTSHTPELQSGVPDKL